MIPEHYLETQFNTFLDEEYSFAIGNKIYKASEALKKIDLPTYKQMFADYILDAEEEAESNSDLDDWHALEDAREASEARFINAQHNYF